MEGWVKLHRKLLESRHGKNAEMIGFWCILLLKASHKDSFTKDGQETKRGSFKTGRKQLSNDSGLSESKCERFLKKLEIAQQIEQQKSNKYRVISIVNYEQYQGSEQESEQQADNKWTTSGQQVDTIKNVKKVKNEKNNKLPNPKIDWVGEAWNNFSSRVNELDPSVKIPKIKIPLSQKRKAYVKKMLADIPDRNSLSVALRAITQNEFNLGKNDRGWVADFDWFIRPTSQNYLKYYELGLANEN